MRRAVRPDPRQPPGPRAQFDILAIPARHGSFREQVLDPFRAQEPGLAHQVDLLRVRARPLPAVHRPLVVAWAMQNHARRPQDARRASHRLQAIAEPVFSGQRIVVEDRHVFRGRQQRQRKPTMKERIVTAADHAIRDPLAQRGREPLIGFVGPDPDRAGRLALRSQRANLH